MINDYLLYIAVAITVTLIPGPAVVLTVKNSLVFGYKTAMANILGNFVAMVLLATLSAFGLGAIILTSTMLFSVVKLLGCMYLVYLGVKAWKSPNKLNVNLPQRYRNRKEHLVSVFKEGFCVGISNPKAIAFFTALFPQFIDLSRAYIPQFISLILTIEGISFVVLLAYAFLSSILSSYIMREQTMSIFNKVTGTVFVGFGVGLLYEK